MNKPGTAPISTNQVDQDYTGTENLEVMHLAHHYNQFICDEIVKNAPSESQGWIDFGAGAGTFAARMKDLGRPPVCIETDPSLRIRLASVGLIAHADLSSTADSSVPYLYTLNVLEHIEKDEVSMKELHRVLKPGRRAFVYVPAMNCLFSSMDKQVGHFRRYSRQELMAKMKNAGFEIEQCSYCDSIGFFVTLLFKLIGNKEGRINPRAIVIYDRFLFPLNSFFDLLFNRWFGKNLLMVAKKR